MDKIDKDYIKKYNLNLKLFDNYNMEVIDIYPVRNVILLNTSKGNKILKKVDYTVDEFNFIIKLLDYTRKKFKNVMKFTLNANGKLYTEYNKEFYCLIDAIDGRESDYNNLVDLEISSKGLGNLHNATLGFITNIKKRNQLGNMIKRFKIRKEEMQFFKKIANLHENKNDFDEIFLKEVDYYIKQIQESIELLKKSNYENLCTDYEKVCICHHDLANHNIIIKNQEAYFIDFDYAIFDLRVHDLANFILKAIKDFAFDESRAISILNIYQQKNKLSKDELKVLYAILTFPEDFYSISKNYYTQIKEWDFRTFMNRLNKKCSYKLDRTEFLNKFKKEIL